jgi:hypothetical protein
VPLPHAALAGNLQHAFAGGQLSLDALFERGIDRGLGKFAAQRCFGCRRQSLEIIEIATP